MSSVKKGINGYSIANTIRLQRTKCEGSFLLVEGENDKKMFNGFCEESVCRITICFGKENLLEAITELNRTKFCGALGFADRDFAQVINMQHFEGNVVFTDENDIEVMILCSTALDTVLNNYGSQNKIPKETLSRGKSVRELIFRSASVVGFLRLLSQKNEWSLSFEDMDYKFASSSSYDLDEAKTVEHVLSRSKKNMDKSNIVADIRNRRSEAVPYKDLCCGHDCIRVLGRAFKSKLGSDNDFNNEKGAKKLQKILRVSYHFELFQQSVACNKIREWEETAGFIILK